MNFTANIPEWKPTLWVVVRWIPTSGSTKGIPQYLKARGKGSHSRSSGQYSEGRLEWTDDLKEAHRFRHTAAIEAVMFMMRVRVPYEIVDPDQETQRAEGT